MGVKVMKMYYYYFTFYPFFFFFCRSVHSCARVISIHTQRMQRKLLLVGYTMRYGLNFLSMRAYLAFQEEKYSMELVRVGGDTTTCSFIS